MTWKKFWSIIDRVRAKADMQDEASVKQFLYTELINLPQDELLGFDCAWQSYRNKANFPKMVAAACIINDGSSDDRFTDFRNWLIMQGYDAYRQALIDPDNLAALNIPFRDTEWMGCGNVAWYAYAGQQLHTYFEKEEIAAKLFRKYPALLKSSADLHQAIMQEQLAPHRAQETEWERQMLRTEVKHYIDTSGLAYSYNEFYTQNMPDKVAWKTLQSDLFANLPQIKAERISVALSIIIVISLVAFVSGSAYGIFFAANAPSTDTITVQQAVEMLTAEYRDRLEEISDTVQHDRQDITANDDVYYIRWQDVLAVFSSYVSGNEQGSPVAALTENQVNKLRETMWAMNAVDYSTHPETVIIDTTDEDGNPSTTEITETVLVIKLTHKTPDEMAADYHFTTRQNTYLQLLQNPQYEELWAELLGGFAQGSGELMNPDSTRTPTGTLQWPLPVAGTITSQFGHRVDPITGEVSSHTGTDIACAEGTPILAAADGIVTVANGLDSWGGSYGYYIQIDHGGGLETLYAHCSSICVTTGQQVQAGEVIGYVGHTGRVTGNHLHLEVRIDGNRADVLRYFTL